jgi:hypothetical protein
MILVNNCTVFVKDTGSSHLLDIYEKHHVGIPGLYDLLKLLNLTYPSPF